MSFSHFVPKDKLLDTVLQRTENNFLIIVGKNGAGKSRYLNSLIQQSSTKYYGFDNIIATSTSIFEIFPAKIQFNEGRDFLKYNYIGTKSTTKSRLNSRTSLNLIVSACLGLLKRYHENNLDKINGNRNETDEIELGHIFNTINFEPTIEFVIKIDPSVNSYRTVFDGISFEKRNETIASEDHPTKVKNIYEFMEKFKYCSDKNNNVRLGYMLGRGIALFQNGMIKSDELETLLWLIDNDVLRIIDVRFSKKGKSDGKNNWHSMRLASSGEQCIIMTLVGIASCLSNNSLIFIDEPEISLHPEWQEKFIYFLHKSFKKYEGCLFIIATHSPHLISKLPENLSYIYDLPEEQLVSSENFIHRSSDYQLANVFNSPGENNEYLSRILITWLVKFSKSDSFSSSERDEIKEALKLKSKLSDTDPVKRLMLLVEDTLGTL